MFATIYIESHLQTHPRVQQITRRFSQARIVLCERYGEVFNPKAQNFRLQKQQPALILAEKYQHHILPAPSGYGIGAQRNYYFSHVLNCLYDCRYCFLQGMYQSANYVLFVNYQDFQQQIAQLCAATPDEPIHFFSGYDGDSLAMEPISSFAAEFVPFFNRLPNAWLELRTKSTQIRSLMSLEPAPRCIVAFSLAPHQIAENVEALAPSLDKRLEALVKLQARGWNIGLRFDPLIFISDYQQVYAEFFAQVFALIDLKQLHSVSLGVFRLPEKYFKKMHKLYPDARLFASPLVNHQGLVSYRADLERELLEFCTTLLLRYIPEEKFFPCHS